MANTILTSQIITREAQRILHQKLNIVGNMNRQYDDRFAKRGAKTTYGGNRSGQLEIFGGKTRHLFDYVSRQSRTFDADRLIG